MKKKKLLSFGIIFNDTLLEKITNKNYYQIIFCLPSPFIQVPFFHKPLFQIPSS